MGNLQNKLISQTYDALIQTGTDEPVDGTLRPLQDGSGQTLPVEISTGAVNFTGTVTGTPNTTYDYGAVGAAGNINFALSGSDASNDVVTMQAGTNITLTDNGSNTFTIDAAGGGGGGAEPGLASTTRGIDMGIGTVNEMWRLTYVPITYGTTTTSITNNTLKIVALQITEGQTIRDFSIYVTAAGGEGPVKALIYKSALNGNGQLTGGALEADFGDIIANTTGQKIITGINHTLGATTEDVYFLAIHNQSGASISVQASNSTQTSGPIYHGSLYASTMYRGNTYQLVTATTPATINGINLTKSTDFPIYGIR